ncbi:hypothetical protein H7J86_24400 [Mycobacterium hackensackense]|uniref:hypothetical protein n=1 Tax=Mycobacterium hackensackense TaxID=228909 RepID=UPI0022659662|nr:hypothetical protein [Mycobacterium hackensackense]MCV7255309.1 hypothetical protein [Mycobacterium hackensackense]
MNAEFPTLAEAHRCAWGPGCSNPDLRDRDNNPQPALIADGLICEGCLWRLTKTVRAAANDWRRLSDAIGERGAIARQRVHGTRDPGIPINVATESLLHRLVDAVDRATSTVESALGMTGAARSRSDSPPDERTAKGYLAVNGKRHTTPSDAFTVAWGANTLLPVLDVLVEAEPQWCQVWMPLPDSDDEADKHPLGQPRELIELSGLDIARELVSVHRLVNLQLGLGYLRNKSEAPCHRCGAETLGRDNGCWDIDCTTCGARYTEDEHGFLIRCTVDEVQSRDEDQMLKYLLAEAYWRLDMLRKRTSLLDDLNDETVAAIIADGKVDELANILRSVADQCATVLTAGDPAWPHPLPEQRQIGVREHEKKQAKQKQLGDTVAAAAEEAREGVAKPLPTGVAYSTSTATDTKPTARRRERSAKR